MNHPFQCRCGSVRGTLSGDARVSRAICFCRSCQAWAHYLNRDAEVLDAAGGTDVLQTQPHHLRFERGLDQLACVRLTEKGPLRWYARCCRSPIGNTLATARLPHLGLIHTCLQHGGTNLDAAFGPVRMHGFTKHARGNTVPRSFGLVGGVVRLVMGAAAARISGKWRGNPFFDVESDTPIAAPRELDEDERKALYARV